MKKSVSAFLLLTICFCLTGLTAPITETPEFLLQGKNQLSAVDHQVDQYDLAVLYSGKDYRKDLFDNYSKDFLLSEIERDQHNKVKISDQLHIPLAPNLDFSDLENEIKSSKFYSVNLFRKYKKELREDMRNTLDSTLTSLSEEDLRTFLSKKHEYLSDMGVRLESLFKKMKMKPRYKFINAFLNSINNMIYMRAQAFVHSNTFGVPLYLTVGFGAAFGRLVYDLAIAKSPLAKYVNPNFGFYFLTAFGVSFSTTKIGTRKIRSLDLFFDIERFKQALTPVFEGFGGFGYGVHFESRNIIETEKGLAKIISANSYKEAKYIPVVGMLKVGDKDFSMNHGFVVTAPLYSLFHDNHFKRKYIHLTYSDSENKKDSGFLKNLLPNLIQVFKTHSFINPSKACLSSYN
jgi:hypothetical protein